MAENQQKRALDIWTPFDMNRKQLATLERGSQYQDVKTEKKVVKEFQRSARADENKEVDKMKNQNQKNEFQRSKKFEEEKEKKEEKSWRRGEAAEDNKNKDKKD